MNASGPMKGSGAHFAPQAMVDQRPVYDNSMRKCKRKRKRRRDCNGTRR